VQDDGRAVTYSIVGAYQPSASTPLFTRNSAALVIVRRCRNEDRIFKINIAGAKC
jgi:hypothetical protein